MGFIGRIFFCEAFLIFFLWVPGQIFLALVIVSFTASSVKD